MGCNRKIWQKKTPKIVYSRSFRLSVCYVKASFNLKYQNQKKGILF